MTYHCDVSLVGDHVCVCVCLFVGGLSTVCLFLFLFLFLFLPRFVLLFGLVLFSPRSFSFSFSLFSFFVIRFSLLSLSLLCPCSFVLFLFYIYFFIFSLFFLSFLCQMALSLLALWSTKIEPRGCTSLSLSGPWCGPLVSVDTSHNHAEGAEDSRILSKVYFSVTFLG